MLKLLYYVLDGGGDACVPTRDAHRTSVSLYEFGDKPSNESYILLRAVIEFVPIFHHFPISVKFGIEISR